MRKLIHIPDDIADDLIALASDHDKDFKVFIEDSLVNLVREDKSREDNEFVQRLENALREYRKANTYLPAHLKASSDLYAQDLLKFVKEHYGI